MKKELVFFNTARARRFLLASNFFHTVFSFDLFGRGILKEHVQLFMFLIQNSLLPAVKIPNKKDLLHVFRINEMKRMLYLAS